MKFASERQKRKVMAKLHASCGQGYQFPEKLNQRQLRIGTKVEMEHTDNKDIARKIATDHLLEDPHYYTKLVKAGL